MKKMYVFEEDGKFKLADHAGMCTAVFPSVEVRQWWIDNYYRKIGVAEFVEGRPPVEVAK